ncbi:amidase [Agrobacterium salinitolerans]|uniref:amidase n=1 Tax=Agrobacterium salinitolerans TaxID=1183413 RepID=UPI00098EA3B0|nr:amidase [Agrobacterium salinitolerans]OOO27701.1 amidase [Agrobacterium salinitolerans]PNQ25601.1 amidase [Rhizobium sp. YIC5082]
MTPDEYTELTAVEIRDLVSSRQVSALEVIEAAFAVLEDAEPHIHAFATLNKEGAIRAARKLDADLAQGQSVGPLAGVPVAIKDLVLTKGLRTTFGSRLYKDFIPEDDDIVVERLKAAGAIVIGKTNASEFGYSAHGCNLLFEPTCNPWDLTKTPGGSSAGSAAAVAAKVCPLSIGSDGGGSIRIPSALTGNVGIKASMGRVPLWPGCRDERLPGASGWESLEHVGPITRNVADAALMLSVIAGADGRDRLSNNTSDVDWLGAASSNLPRGLRVAYWPDWNDQPTDPRIKRKVTEAVGKLSEAYGFDVVESSPPALEIVEAFQTIMALETDITGVRRLVEESHEPVGEALHELLARNLPFEAATDAITTRKAFVNAMAVVMGSFDLILTPTVALLPIAADGTGKGQIAGKDVSYDDYARFTFPFNLTGQPAASIQCGIVDSFPVGLQIVGRHLDDATVLRAAASFERVLPPQNAPLEWRKVTTM